MMLFGVAYELGVATANDERTVCFLASLLDFLPRYPIAPRSAILPRSLLDDPSRPVSLNFSDADWSLHTELVDALFVSELLNDIDCAIARIVSAYPCKSALAPLRRRVDEQHSDPGAWFSARFLTIGSTLEAIRTIEPNDPCLTEFDLKADLDQLNASSCSPHLVPDRAGTVFVSGRGQHRLVTVASDSRSFEQYVSLRLPDVGAGNRVEPEDPMHLGLARSQ